MVLMPALELGPGEAILNKLPCPIYVLHASLHFDRLARWKFALNHLDKVGLSVCH